MTVQGEFIPTSVANNVTVGPYQLAYDPFANNSASIYVPESWFAKFEFIQHLTMFNNVLIVLLGEVGSGKTTFIKTLMSKVDNQIMMSSLQQDEILNLDHLLLKINADFNLKSSNQPSIDDIVLQINQRKKHCLLILDDAESIDQSIIKSLIKGIKSQDSHGYFHVLVASDYSILEYLGSNLEVDNEGLIHSIELSVLNPQEIKSYVSTVLEQAGYIGELALNYHQLSQLTKISQGNIRKINQFMSDFFQHERIKVSKDMEFQSNNKGVLTRVSKVAATAVPLLLVAIVITFLMPERTHHNEQTASLQLPSQTPAMTVSAAVFKSSIANYKYHSNVVELHDDFFSEQAMLEEKAAKFTVGEFAKHSSAVIDKVIIAPKHISDFKQLSAANLREDLPLKSKIPVVNRIASVKASPSVKTKMVNNLTAQTKPVKPQGKVNAITHSNRTKEGFTIQLVATKNLSSLRNYVKNNHLENQVHYYSIEAAGKSWYVLGLGHYATKEQAKKAIVSLPKNLTKNKPWVRSSNQLKRLS